MKRLRKKASVSFLNDHGIVVMQYVDKMVDELIAAAAPKAAEEIGYQFDQGVEELIRMSFDNKIQMNPLITVQDIYETLDAVIMEWQEDTMENHM